MTNTIWDILPHKSRTIHSTEIYLLPTNTYGPNLLNALLYKLVPTTIFTEFQKNRVPLFFTQSLCLQKQAWHSKTGLFLAKNMLQLEQNVHYMNELRLQRWQNGHFKESFASTRYFLPFQKRQRLTSTYLSCSPPLLLLDEKGNKKVTANFLNSTAHFTTKCSNPI